MPFKYNVRGENIEVTDAIRAYVEKRVDKLLKYFPESTEATAHVNMKVYSEKTAKVEVTIPLPNLTLRAEETSIDMYGSVDLVVDKLERQIRKYKTRINRKKRDAEPTGEIFLAGPAEEMDDDFVEETADIVRTKRFNLSEWSAEEAVIQMEMLGHDFYVFKDVESGNTGIVYRRKDGKHGLIEVG
ncbi:MAG: ribosome-associated translation inhibitor RaiA [Streptococcaceae bacterium]|jgi:putative sigma-54 modulation protein|nr:ribosome-associated translation inhibitor RaiA [Streptococcaceae bacterium]